MESRVLLLIVALFLPYSQCGRSEMGWLYQAKSTRPQEHESFVGSLIHKNETKCYYPIGCLTITKEWYSVERPFNSFPISRQAVGTNFKLYTKENLAGEPLKVNENGDVESKYFKIDKDTKFIIHGWMEKGSADGYMRIMLELLQRMEMNVIIVDWAKGAADLYKDSTSNTRLVGLEIGYLVNTLIAKKGADPSKFHLIGHSLGAQVAGYAGEQIKNLGRITGLDPAGPYFRGMPTFVRLDPSDAVLVDTIRTDKNLGFGTNEQQLGHMEFYPNGGKLQPGCSPSLEDGGLLGFPLCSHRRSVDLFRESILSSPFHEEGSCPFTSFKCDSYKDFLDGKCSSCGNDGSNCALMGLDADKYPSTSWMRTKKFFLKTNAAAPFCGYHYGVNLKVSNKLTVPLKVVGDLKVTAKGEKGTTADMPLTETGALTLHKGGAYSLLGFSSKQTGKVTTAGLQWDWNPNSLVNKLCVLCRKDLDVSDFSVANLGYYPSNKMMTCESNESAKIDDGARYNFQLRC